MSQIMLPTNKYYKQTLNNCYNYVCSLYGTIFTGVVAWIMDIDTIHAYQHIILM